AEPRESGGLATPTEEILAGLWSSLLAVGRVGRDDSFFALGGHSLLATRLAARIQKTFAVTLPLKTVFEAPTLAGLSQVIDREQRAGRQSTAPPLAPAEPLAEPVLSFAEERLWFLDQLEPDSASYNLPTALRLTGRLHVPALAASLREIVRRHEALRTAFPKVAGAPRRVVQAAELPLPVVDLGALPAAPRDEEALRLASADTQRPFDLALGPLLRATLVRLAPDGWLALFCLHHIVGDGWSLGVLTTELAALYAAFVEGRPSLRPAGSAGNGGSSGLAELPLQVRDVAIWQRRFLRGEVLAEQVDYWRRELAGAPAVLDLPADRPRPAVQSPRGASFGFTLPAALATALRALGTASGATLFMTLLASFHALLSRLSGQDDVLVGTPVANRTHREMEGLIGFFVNTLVLRGRLESRPSFAELLVATRHGALGAYAHQDLPFERLVDELAVPRSLAHSPLFQVVLALQSAPGGELALPGLTLAAIDVPNTTAKFDLTVSLAEAGDALAGTLEHGTDLYDRTTMQRLLGQWETLLAGAVAAPAMPVSALPLLAAWERQQVVVEWGEWGEGAGADGSAEVPVHELVVRRARRAPDALAIAAGAQRLSYGELLHRAERLAARLRREGVGPEVRVAVLLDRSAELV
ncbi:MAG TPA: condensation domain-containing protein, partial [Thermoanaerobaculia bacterium]